MRSCMVAAPVVLRNGLRSTREPPCSAAQNIWGYVGAHIGAHLPYTYPPLIKEGKASLTKI